MKKDIYDEWISQASIKEIDEIDALRKVLDPSDGRGVKNSYIDAYLKHYLRKHLFPNESDILLEVGCGIGRLTEYMSQFVHSVYGIDIIDKFIDDCNANPRKNKNTYYIKISAMDKLREISIDKMYMVWVLMYLTDTSELISTLDTYREKLPNLKTGVAIEQVTSNTQLRYRDGKIDCCYRTINEYIEIFNMSGFKVKSYFILGERYNGPIYNLIHLSCNFLPRKLVKFADKLFYIDKYLLGENGNKIKLINNKRPTDVVFNLEIA